MTEPCKLMQGQPRRLAFKANVRKDLRLLEVPESILQEILSNGVTIKGREAEEAVLCTTSSTYAVKHAETTNSIFLIAPDQEAGVEDSENNENAESANLQGEPGPSQKGRAPGLLTQHQQMNSADNRPKVVVSATANAVLELVLCAPRWERLDAMLQTAKYGLEDEDCGEEAADAAAGSSGMDVDGEETASDPSVPSQGYTFAQLLANVQASEGELRAALAERGAVELNGRWRLVDADYEAGLLELLLVVAVQMGWPLEEIPADEAIAGLQGDGYRQELVLHCLRQYGRQKSDGPPETAIFELQQSKVCLVHARRLLAQKKWLLLEFMQQWQEAVPEGMAVDMDMLRGEALVEGKADERSIRAWPAAALPTDPAKRFTALFQERPKWEWADLEPYMKGIEAPGQAAEAMLLKYARASQTRPTDPVVYSSRY